MVNNRIWFKQFGQEIKWKLNLKNINNFSNILPNKKETIKSNYTILLMPLYQLNLFYIFLKPIMNNMVCLKKKWKFLCIVEKF